MRNKTRPNYRDSSTVSEDNANDPDNLIPPILRKNRSFLPSLDISLAAFPLREISKSAPPNATENLQVLFEKGIKGQGREQGGPVEGTQTGAIVTLITSQSDSDDSSAEEDQDEQQMKEVRELNSTNLSREELKNSFSQFNEFLETRKELEKDEETEENVEPYGGIMSG